MKEINTPNELKIEKNDSATDEKLSLKKPKVEYQYKPEEEDSEDEID